MVLSLKKHEKHLQHQSQEAPALTRSERLVGVNFGHHLFFFQEQLAEKTRYDIYYIGVCIYIYIMYIYIIQYVFMCMYMYL